MREIRSRRKIEAAVRRASVPAVVEGFESRTLLSAVSFTAIPTSITEIDSSTAGKQYVDTGTYTPVAGVTGNAGTTSSSKATVYEYYQIYEFDTPNNPIFPAPGQLSSITGLNLQIYDSGESASGTKYAASPGGFNVYLIPNTTNAGPDSSLIFNSDVTGLVGQAGVDSTALLGTIDFSSPPTTAGYLPFTVNPSIASNTLNTLLSDLNSGTPFRIAVTPNTATTAADNLEGDVNGTEAPSLNITGTGSAAEQFGFSSAAYDVNETAGTAIFSVVRTGENDDSASVNWSTTPGGTAVAGTNYTASSGTVNFTAGQSVATFSVPVLDASPMGGNQTFNVTLSSPSASGGGPTSFGTQTATETVIDASPLTDNLTGPASSVTDIESSGSYSTTYAPVVGDMDAGTGSFSYPAFEVLEFSQATTPSIYPGLGQTVNSVQNLSLQLFNSATSGNYGGHPGNFDVYFIPNSDTTTKTSSLKFQFADPTGLNGQAGTGAATLLGTFSFSSAAVGFDTYTPASIPSSVASSLVYDLNTDANFRLAITPQTGGVGAIAADWDGLYASSTPTLSFTASVTQTAQPEYIAFSTPTYSVNEFAGNETITLTRTGDTADSATVNYATSDGTALAGTNYVATSGTATFAAGSSTATFVVPITNVYGQGGNKTLNLSLSTPASAGPGTIAALGSQSTALLTIMDSDNTASNTETLTQYASDVSDIEKSGPYTNDLFKVEGNSGVSGYPSYAAADFNDSVIGPNGADYFTPSMKVTAINSITLSVYNGSAGTSGPVDVYLVPDATSNIDPSSPQSQNPHYYDSTNLPEGLGTGANSFGTPMLLGQVNWNASTPAFSQVQIPLLNYSAATEQTLVNDLNSQTKFRIVATPENTTVYADWEGETFDNGVLEAPQLSFNVTEASSNVPVLVSTQVGDGSAQRSSIRAVSLTFSSPVNFTTSSFTLYQETLNSNGTIDTSVAPTDVSQGVGIVINGDTVTLQVKPGGILDRTGASGAQFFLNGIYQLVLHGQYITDSATGQNQFYGGADQDVSFQSGEAVSGTSPYFHVLFGDVNGDGTVNALDARQFLNSYLAATGSSNYNIAFDWNGDGVINATDARVFTRDYLLKYTY